MNRLNLLKPKQCAVPRFIVAWFTLWVGIPRLPFFDASFSPLKFIDPWIYGVIMTTIGIGLLITSYKWRTAIAGRIIASIGFVVWIGLAVATTSATSVLIDFTIAVILFLEVIARHACNAEIKPVT